VTYSVNAKGVRADNPPQIQNLVLSDTQSNVGAQQNAMSDNVAFLCKGPDGVERYYVIDASRYVAGQPPVLIPLV
jgi:hypothetical protein